MDIKRDVTIKTWDGTWTYHPKVIATPESAEDIVEIMVDEVRFPSPVRPARRGVGPVWDDGAGCAA